ncbi:MAG: hypothetical protein WBA67_01730 [Jannaschia sp.]
MTPIKLSFLLAAMLVLSACGGGGYRSGGTDVVVARSYATGPLQTACLRSDRRAANRQLCGCVQAAANATLSGGDQTKAVRFFKDPHLAQEVRQSDRASDEAFWKRYRSFVDVAERSCA